jgi:hypothetical protein
VSFVRLAYRLGREAATGRLVFDRHQLYVRRGYLTYTDVAGTPVGQILVDSGVADRATVERTVAARGPRLTGHALRAAGTVTDADVDAALRRQAELRLARLAELPLAGYRFDPDAPAPPAHRSGRPVALAAWARRHIEARFDLVRARALAASLDGERLVLHKQLAPDPGDLDEIERAILAALATPRSLAELAAHAPERRLLAFLHFLVGAGIVAAPDPARDLLGVAAGSDAATLKQAYRRRVRQLHPDLHPGASADRRRALETELCALNEAYRQLTKIG